MMTTNNYQSNSSLFDNGTLIKLYEYGHDSSGRFSHINVSYGLVDVRRTKSNFYAKNAEGICSGYQRIPTQKRIEGITNEFSKARLAPITVAVINGNAEIIDGQGRDTAVKSLYRQKKIDNFYVPCTILENATEDDCGVLFAKQDDGTVQIDNKSKTKVMAAHNDNETVDFLNHLVKNGLPVYNNQTKEIHNEFNALSTYRNIYNSFESNNDMETFDRIIKVISDVWVTDEASGRMIMPKALNNMIIKAFSEFYKKFKNDINDKSFITRLQSYTPQDVLDVIDDNAPKNKRVARITDKKTPMVKAIVSIYNSKRQTKPLMF